MTNNDQDASPTYAQVMALIAEVLHTIENQKTQDGMRDVIVRSLRALASDWSGLSALHKEVWEGLTVDREATLAAPGNPLTRAHLALLLLAGGPGADQPRHADMTVVWRVATCVAGMIGTHPAALSPDGRFTVWSKNRKVRIDAKPVGTPEAPYAWELYITDGDRRRCVINTVPHIPESSSALGAILRDDPVTGQTAALILGCAKD